MVNSFTWTDLKKSFITLFFSVSLFDAHFAYRLMEHLVKRKLPYSAKGWIPS